MEIFTWNVGISNGSTCVYVKARRFSAVEAYAVGGGAAVAVIAIVVVFVVVPFALFCIQFTSGGCYALSVFRCFELLVFFLPGSGLFYDLFVYETIAACPSVQVCVCECASKPECSNSLRTSYGCNRK